MYGYGRIAEIDLSNKKIEIKDPDENLVYEFIGGRGWASYFIFKELDKIVGGVHPSNLLVVAAGPLTGTLFQSGGKTTFAAISPQTEIYGDSNVGGFIGFRLRKAGIDSLIIRGRSSAPSHLYVEDGRVEIIESPEIWGLKSSEVDEKLRKRYGEECSIASIGIAGEKLVSYACVNVDWNMRKYRHGQAGRTGVGAVMGSKNLKAIVVKGSGEVKVADPDKLRDVAKRFQKQVLESSAYNIWRRQGTMSVIEWSNNAEALPVYNFQKTRYEYSDHIGGEAMEKIKLYSRPCSNCIVPCEHVIPFKIDEERGEIGLEYETAAMLGSNIGLKNLGEIAYANYLCDDYGVDTITMGSVIGFVMECFQRGILSEEDIGFKVGWGDIKAISRLIKMTAEREGFGELMSLGVKRLSEKIGKGSEKFAMHVKGLEISAYDHRAAPAMALSYATCDIGAHHNRSWAITYDLQVGRESYGEDKVDRVIYLQHLRPLFDMLGVCRFYWVELGVDPNLYAEAYSALTGKEVTLNDLLRKSERVWNLTRVMAIIRKNVSIEDDMLPIRDFEDPVPEGSTKGAKLSRERFIEMLRSYYKKRGWDENGRPTKEKLVELGLLEAVKKLYG
ncbi:MAG: aldehyde ferredoxin oxidoreductase family protein [Nitrososphaeria archaeon]|nr:aldehyde ferredoxin oxidoreductase family protein [Nitrososphaeria archaeon]MDW7985873.1 aldehyde ferredoxin oxidoreductase family protein [Nitrososphaerota archaeon]